MGDRQFLARDVALDQARRSGRDPCLHARVVRVHDIDTTSHQNVEAPCAKERRCGRVVLSDAGEQRAPIPQPDQLGEELAADAATPGVGSHEHDEDVPRGMLSARKQRPGPDDVFMVHTDQSPPPPILAVQVGAVDSRNRGKSRVVGAGRIEQRTDCYGVFLQIRPDHARTVFAVRLMRMDRGTMCSAAPRVLSSSPARPGRRRAAWRGEEDLR